MSSTDFRVHISLNVKSVDRSIDFYQSLFGTQASKVRDGYANFRLTTPPIHLALQQGGIPSSGGVSHLGVELPSHELLAQWEERLKYGGVEFSPENDAQCCYAKADKLWLTDPDGYRWEVWVRTGEFNEMGQTRLDAKQPTAACC